MRTLFILLALCAAVYLPGFFTIPTIDRDEARFAQASRQMLQSATPRGWLVPMVQDRPRLNKPPLIYWLQAASAGVCSGAIWLGNDAIARDAIWMYRLPSLLAAVGIVLATWRLGVRMFDPRVGKLGAALLAVSPVLYWESHQARSDLVMVLWTTLALLPLWNIWKRRRHPAASSWGHAIALWAFVALGVMTKGPITLMVVLLGALTLSTLTGEWKWWGRLRPWLGVIVIGAMLGPWVYAVASDVGLDRYREIVLDETLGRSLQAKEGHRGPPGYHTLLLVPMLGAGSLLTGAGILRAARPRGPESGLFRRLRAHARARPAAAFCLCVLAPSWIVLELVMTKLPHYTLPLYPIVALLSARMVLAADHSRDLPRLPRIGAYAWIAMMLVFVALGGEAIRYAFLRFGVHGYEELLPAVALVALAFLVAASVRSTLRWMNSQQWLNLQRWGAAISVLAFALLSLGLSTTPAIRTSENLAKAIAKADPTGSRPIAAVGYHEDSLIFETRGRAQRVDESSLPQWLRDHPGAILVVQRPTPTSITAFRAFAQVRGFNYSKGRYLTVDVGESGAP